MPPAAFISQIAKKDSIYFTEPAMRTAGNNDLDTIRSPGCRPNGTTYICNLGVIRSLETCYRNYEYARLTELAFNQYLGILLSSDPLHRGKILSSLINNLVRLGSLTPGIPANPIIPADLHPE